MGKGKGKRKKKAPKKNERKNNFPISEHWMMYFFNFIGFFTSNIGFESMLVIGGNRRENLIYFLLTAKSMLVAELLGELEGELHLLLNCHKKIVQFYNQIYQFFPMSVF